MAHLRPHNDSEENEDLPKLEPILGVERSKEAAATFSRTKKFVPTRFVFQLARNLQLIQIQGSPFRT